MSALNDPTPLFPSKSSKRRERVEELVAAREPHKPDPLLGTGGQPSLSSPSRNGLPHLPSREQIVGLPKDKDLAAHQSHHSELEGTIFPFGSLPPLPEDLSFPDVGGESFGFVPDTGFADCVAQDHPKMWSRLGEPTHDENPDVGKTNPADVGSKGKPKVGPRKEDWGGWLASLPSGPESDPALARARRRNSVRLRKANEADWSLISKYLPSDVSFQLFSPLLPSPHFPTSHFPLPTSQFIIHNLTFD